MKTHSIHRALIQMILISVLSMSNSQDNGKSVLSQSMSTNTNSTEFFKKSSLGIRQSNFDFSKFSIIPDDRFNYDYFMECFFTIFFSGFGDKSFFVTTLMAMKYGKLLVFLACTIALNFMGVLSVLMGLEINKFISPTVIDIIAIAIFLFTGIYITLSGFRLPDRTDDNSLVIKDPEYSDEEEYLMRKTGKKGNLNELSMEIDLESCKLETDANVLVAFSSVFMLTFFSELGDRSQVSTIYLSTHYGLNVVFASLVMSNIILTSIAILFGKLISDNISMRKMTIFMGGVFLVYGIVALLVFAEENFIRKD